MSEQQFRAIEPEQISDDVSLRIANRDTPYSWMVLTDKDPHGPTFLDIDEARKLRDWINRALPAEETKS